MQYGLSSDTIQRISGVFSTFPAVEKAVLYGSRAKGNYKTGSDIDLTLYGEQLTPELLGDISEALDNLLLPYTIDLSLFDELEHAKLREHIERVGVSFYMRAETNTPRGRSWRMKRLGDICKTGAGGTPLTSKEEYYEQGTIPWLQSGEVNQGEIFAAKNFITPLGLENSSAKLFPKNTVLIAMYGANAGEAGILRFEASTNQAVCGILPSDYFEPKFLYYLFLSKYDELASQAVGNAQPNISQAKIKDTLVPLVDITEQQRIVAVLDDAFAGIATATENAKKNLQNARELFESHLQSIFTTKGNGWEEKKLGDVAHHSLGKMLDKAKNKGVAKKYLRNINVRWLNCDLSDLLEMRFLPEEEEKYTAIKGDVLICEGGYPGRAAIWQEDYAIHFQKALHRVRFREPKYNKYFVYYLYYLEKSGLLKAHCAGAGIQHFTGQALHKLPLVMPPLEQIDDIVARVDTLSTETKRLEAIYQQKLEILAALKQAILQKAFAGELRMDRLAA